MDPYLFSADWARACQTEINTSTSYREAATTWEGAVAFVVDDGPRANHGVYVDLWHGECREARNATPEDLDKAPFVIRGDEQSWEDVLKGSLEPLNALVLGRLKLAKGNLGALAFHIKSARELVACASRVSQRRRSMGGAV